MIQSIQHYTSSATSTQPGQQASATDPLASKEVFLQLLVAQLKNQDPLQPQDGVQFVSQLAQFSQLEQSAQQTQDLDAIKLALSQTQTTPGGK